MDITSAKNKIKDKFNIERVMTEEEVKQELAIYRKQGVAKALGISCLALSIVNVAEKTIIPTIDKFGLELYDCLSGTLSTINHNLTTKGSATDWIRYSDVIDLRSYGFDIVTTGGAIYSTMLKMWIFIILIMAYRDYKNKEPMKKIIIHLLIELLPFLLGTTFMFLG